MKQHFLKQGYSENLLLIFSGWATDERLFSTFRYPKNYDVCVVSDYVDGLFDLDVYKKYQGVQLFAWSLGVFMAEVSLRNASLPIIDAVALNGTLTPVNDETGIPKCVYEGTARNLNEVSLLKFYRRMGENKSDYDFLCKCCPSLSVERLRQSLEYVEALASEQNLNVQDSLFKKVIIGTKDRIFPPANMVRGWSGFPNLQCVDVPHFDSHFMEQQIYGERL